MCCFETPFGERTVKTYYTYLWLREDGTPYYVGKGTGDRAFISDGHSCRRPKDSRNILIQEFPNETSAFAAEKFLISYFGRKDLGTGTLQNHTDGGDGISNVSADTRRKMSEAARKHPGNRKGHKESPEVCKKKSERMLGRTPWNKGKALTPEHRSALCVPKKSFPPRPPEFYIKLVENRRRNGSYVQSAESRRKAVETRRRNGGFVPWNKDKRKPALEQIA